MKNNLAYFGSKLLFRFTCGLYEGWKFRELRFFILLGTLCSVEDKRKSKIVILQTKLPVGIRRLQGVHTRNDLSSQASRGDSTPSKPVFLFILFCVQKIRRVTFDVSLDIRVHTTCVTSRANQVIYGNLGQQYLKSSLEKNHQKTNQNPLIFSYGWTGSIGDKFSKD